MAESTYMAMLKKYISQETLRQYRDRYTDQKVRCAPLDGLKPETRNLKSETRTLPRAMHHF